MKTTRMTLVKLAQARLQSLSLTCISTKETYHLLRNITNIAMIRHLTIQTLRNTKGSLISRDLKNGIL